MALPALREELAIYPGPAARNGSPTWSLYDPVRNLFFRIDWLTFEILSRWYLDDADLILQQITVETTIHPQTGDLKQVIDFLGDNELLQRHDPEGTDWYQQQAIKRRSYIFTWLLHNYLFFRIPLWRPNLWLDDMLPWVGIFFRNRFFIVTLMVLALSLVEVSQQWPKFMSTLVDTFSWQGLVAYSVTLVFIKFLHELGHAFTAKRYGCRVPTMGVAFLVLFPMAYTDVNEVWKLPNRQQRLAVGAAGIVTELIIAAWATLAWILLPDGVLRDGAFLLATTTWISTLIINSSPFLRFDGYFLLMDWLDMPNLHQRAFALGKWRLRELLFGLNEPIPEHLSPRRYHGILLYAYFTWLYRLVIFMGIAIMVYTLLPKPLGPVLAAIEIAWFIWLPVWKELGEWRQRLPAIIRSRRSKLTAAILGALLMVIFLPWDPRVNSQGLLKPTIQMPLVAPAAAQVKALPVSNAQTVTEGQHLIQLDSPDINLQLEAAKTRAANLEWQVGTTGVSDNYLERQQVLTAAYNKAEAEIHAAQAELKKLHPSAQFGGQVYITDPNLHVGAWLGKNEQYAVLVNNKYWQVETYLPEAELSRIKVGDRGHFYSETPGEASLAIKVSRIDKDASRMLAERMLASTHGGELLVRENQKQLVPEKALYRITLMLDEAYTPEKALILRGKVVLYGKPKAYMSEFTQAAASVFVREAGF